MCNLYSLTRSGMTSHASSASPTTGPPRSSRSTQSFPDSAPWFARATDGEREIVLMSWGFIGLRREERRSQSTNVRDDQIQDEPVLARLLSSGVASCLPEHSASRTAT